MATEDGGYYLRATATYTDGYDSDQRPWMATTTSAVVSNSDAPMFADGQYGHQGSPVKTRRLRPPWATRSRPRTLTVVTR